jgi:hypothetical protein
MAHYAFLDENNIVTEVIVGKDEGTDGIDWEQKYGEIKGQTCKRTSYNTIANTHLLDGTPFRGNYAGIGFTYDEVNDVFVEPKPYDSWILDTNIWIWKAPIEKPTLTEEDINFGNYYDWNEETTSWDYYSWNEETANWELVE